MKNILLIPLLLLAMSVAAQYERGANVISITNEQSKEDALKSVKGLLLNNLYSIQTYDADFYIVETAFKSLKNVQVRLRVNVTDDLITFRAWATNGMGVGAYSGGMSISSSPSELRAEFRNTNITVMSQGFEEMKRLVLLYKDSFNGSVRVYKE